MHITAYGHCRRSFDAPLAPCPDGRVGCLVAHLAKTAFVCPHCSHDNGPAVVRIFREGRVTAGPGISIWNPKAIDRLKLA